MDIHKLFKILIYKLKLHDWKITFNNKKITMAQKYTYDSKSTILQVYIGKINPFSKALGLLAW